QPDHEPLPRLARRLGVEDARELRPGELEELPEALGLLLGPLDAQVVALGLAPDDGAVPRLRDPSRGKRPRRGGREGEDRGKAPPGHPPRTTRESAPCLRTPPDQVHAPPRPMNWPGSRLHRAAARANLAGLHDPDRRPLRPRPRPPPPLRRPG